MTTEQYTQSKNIYDDDYNLIDTVTANGIISRIELADIRELTGITYVLHTPNKYLSLQNGEELFTAGKLEKTDALTKAEYGTLQFVFFNLDPADKNFAADREKMLSRFAYGSSSSVILEMYLPAAFEGAAIYTTNEYVATVGDMDDYSPADYVDVYAASSFVPNSTGLEPQHIELIFGVNENTISPDRLEAARIVTVHYKASRGVDFSDRMPLVGKRETVRASASGATATHIGMLAVAVATLVAFTALALLKRSRAMAAYVASLLGTALYAVSGLLICVAGASAGAALAYSATAVMLAAPILIRIDNTALTAKIQLAAIVAAATIAKAFIPIAGTVANPALFVSVLTVPLAMWLIGYEIFRTERRDELLKTNLQAEVNTQTTTLKNALSDRDKILSFISHDMRKSALGIGALTTDLMSAATDDE